MSCLTLDIHHWQKFFLKIEPVKAHLRSFGLFSAYLDLLILAHLDLFLVHIGSF